MRYIDGMWIYSEFAKNGVVSLVSVPFLAQLVDISEDSGGGDSVEESILSLDEPIIIRIGLSEDKMAVIEGDHAIKYAIKESIEYVPVTFQLSNHIPSEFLSRSYPLSIYSDGPDLVDLWVSHGKVIHFEGFTDVKYVNPDRILLSEYVEKHYFD